MLVYASWSADNVIGSQAYWLGKVNRRPEEHSHDWHVYLRGPGNEDLSYFISKVVFFLHESFNPPRRGWKSPCLCVADDSEFEYPPYEVSESGWGEFDIAIQIFFVDPAEKPVTLYHSLKLFPKDGSTPSTEVPVVTEVHKTIFICVYVVYYVMLLSVYLFLCLYCGQ